MADIGQLCFQCADLGDDDCKMCPLGNPCLNCEDYDKVNDICKSNGGCAPERRTDETIDADAALKALRKCQTYLYDARDPELKIELSSAEAAINNLPTIQPVATDTNVGNNSKIPNSSDAVSRQAAIDALDVLCQEHRYKIPGKRETYSEYNEAWQDALDRAEGPIFNLPPAQPEPTYEQVEEYCKKRCLHVVTADFFESTKPQRLGHWIKHIDPFDGEQYECSECGVLWEFNDGSPEDNEAYFCPKCGAKMTISK